MTLVACLHPGRHRTLLADLILSTDVPGGTALRLPTGAYFAPERLSVMQRQPFATCRKVVELSPGLILLWSGSADSARRVAAKAMAWFGDDHPTEDEAEGFIQDLDPSVIADFSGVLAQFDSHWLFGIGSFVKGESRLVGEYVAAGSGAAHFQSIATNHEVLSSDLGHPDIVGLRLASDLLSQEIWTGSPIDRNFGGSYEVFVRGQDRFHRLDDVMHMFTTVRIVDTEASCQVEFHPHVMRQWYEGSRLMISTMATPEVERQGLGFRTAIAPSVLETEEFDWAAPGSFVRPLSDFAMLPRYLCVSNHFELGNRSVDAIVIMKEPTISNYVAFTVKDDRFDIDFSREFYAILAKKAREIVQMT